MENLWKVTMLMLLSLILTSVIGKQEKDLALVLSMIVCCMGAMTIVSYLEPVLDLLRELEALARLQDGFLGILLKAAGIALVTELAGLVCRDGGNGTLGKTLQIIGSSAVLYLSVPIFRSLLRLIQEILGQL